MFNNKPDRNKIKLEFQYKRFGEIITRCEYVTFVQIKKGNATLLYYETELLPDPKTLYLDNECWIYIKMDDKPVM